MEIGWGEKRWGEYGVKDNRVGLGMVSVVAVIA